MTAYNKFIVAALGAVVTGLSAFGYNVAFLTPELQATLASALTAILVYFVPNIPKA